MSRSLLPALILLTGACASGTSAPRGSAPGAPTAVIPTATGAVVRLTDDSLRSIAEFQAPLDTVWNRLPAVYRALGIPAELGNVGTWTFGTRRFTQRRVAGLQTLDVVHCGHEGAGPSAVRARRVRLSIVSTLRRLASGATRLTTEVSGEAIAIDGTSTGAVRCVSNGELEQRIAAELAAQLGSGREAGWPR